MPGTIHAVTFTPASLTIPTGGTATVDVEIDLDLNARDLARGFVRIRLIDADVLADDLLDQVDLPIPRHVRAAGRTTLRHTFTLMESSGHVAGPAGSSGESSAELSIEFGAFFGTNHGSCSASV